MSDELKKAAQELTAQAGLPQDVEFDVVLPTELDEIVKGAMAGELVDVKSGLTALIKAVTSMNNAITDIKSDNEALTKSLVNINEAADLIKGNQLAEVKAKRAEPESKSDAVSTNAADVIAKGAAPAPDPREQEKNVGELTGDQAKELEALMEKARDIRDNDKILVKGFSEILTPYQTGKATVEQFEALKKGVSLASA